MPTITFIGDVHGHIDKYLKLIEDVDFSVQLGDMGFDYSKLYNIDTNHHRFVPGNHDNYPVINTWLRESRSFPVNGLFRLGGVEMYAFRGGLSIDRYIRVEGIDWFADEEMSHWNLRMAIDEIVENKPKIIVSHVCPVLLQQELVCRGLGDIVKYAPTVITARTEQAMQTAFDLISVKPDYWIFGHHHVWFDETIEGTRFVCVPELCRFQLFIP
ncbi:MAG: metallophosphoesterase [Planctomycetaceae bacterium]|jgi:predicted phosphodiesterase|nr:metallophosphoesterase [Planctomycetaceae bacterium]